MSTPAPAEVRIDPAQLEILRLRALRGPNYWRLAPVIACDLGLGTLESVTTADAPEFNDRLRAALPTLHNHPCSRGHPGGLIERLEEGTGWGHVLEHVALELQTLAGTDVDFGRVINSPRDGSCWVILEYLEEEVGLASVRLGVELMRACLDPGAPPPAAPLDQMRDVHERVRLGPSTAVVVE